MTLPPLPSPARGLPDSHMSQHPTMLDGVELNQALEHDDGAGLSVVAGPAAEARKDPRGIGERALGMRIFLPCRLAFEACRDRFESAALGVVDGILERTLGRAIALAH